MRHSQYTDDCVHKLLIDWVVLKIIILLSLFSDVIHSLTFICTSFRITSYFDLEVNCIVENI